MGVGLTLSLWQFVFFALTKTHKKNLIQKHHHAANT